MTTIRITSDIPADTTDFRTVVVDAQTCTTTAQFYAEVGDALGFPPFFQHNPESFRDILEEYDIYTPDMSNLRLVFTEAAYLFADEPNKSELLDIHFQIFSRVAKRWQTKESWDEDDKQLYIFEAVLVASGDEAEKLRSLAAPYDS